jgi:hypothetical protein
VEGDARVSHFTAMVSFALLISVALGCLSQQSTKGRAMYAVWTFVLFIGAALVIAWMMYPFSR